MSRFSLDLQEDPLTLLSAPPPDETAEAMQKRLRSEAEARRVSDEIDEWLKTESLKRRNKKAVKLLLLGQSESGKSTTLKNFQLTYARKAWERERLSWRVVVQLNLIRSMKLILDVMTKGPAASEQEGQAIKLPNDLLRLKLSLAPLKHVERQLCEWLGASSFEVSPSPDHSVSAFDEPDADASQRSPRRSDELFVWDHSSWKNTALNNKSAHNKPSTSPTLGSGHDQVTEILVNCKDNMDALWKNPTIRQLLEIRHVKLQDSAEFFLNDIQRIATYDYIPTDDDIMRARLRTMGVQEYKLELDDQSLDWYIYDVGGAYSQRTAWVPYFEDCSAIIFLAPVSCIDERLSEDPKVNRLEDTFLLWKSICSSPILTKVVLIIFLNKTDILETKLGAGMMVKDHLSSYGHRPNETSAVVAYLREQFKQVLKANSKISRPFYGYPTVAVDTEATKKTIKLVHDGILKDALRKLSLI